MKVRIGITGQEGFVGQHLYNSIGLYDNEFERVHYDISFFSDQSLLEKFVSNCDVIVHLAALNRHNDPQVLHDTNIKLVHNLIDALTTVKSKSHVVFSSSSQEERDNLYGKSKREGRELLASWAQAAGGKVTGLVIPNVFGPFGNPFYNSFIATFCHQLTHGQQPVIDVDGSVKLIYVNDLVNVILHEIRTGVSNPFLAVSHTDEYKVSEILALLEAYKEQYYLSGIIPELKSKFEINLFNTYRSYIDAKTHFPIKLKKSTDNRGSFVEVIKLHQGGQFSFSTTVPDITRGNHYHTRKIERFAVIKGKALIQLRRIGTNERLDFYLDGEEPAYVDMPVWYTHNIKNIGDDVLYTNFWINEFFDPEDTDTYFENV